MKQVNLQLEDNSIEVYINSDPTRNIVFNPTAIGFVENYIALVNFARTAQDDPKYKVDALVDSDDLDVTVDAIEVGIKAHKLFFNDLCDKVDSLFGAGTSMKATQGNVDLDILIKLMTGLAQHIDAAQQDRLKNYTANREARRAAPVSKQKTNKSK